MLERPETRYACTSDGTSIAYQVCGQDGPDLVYVPNWASPIDLVWDHPLPDRFLSELASIARLILFDTARMLADAQSMFLAEAVAGARYVELAGDDPLPYVGDVAAVLEEIEEFPHNRTPAYPSWRDPRSPSRIAGPTSSEASPIAGISTARPELARRQRRPDFRSTTRSAHRLCTGSSSSTLTRHMLRACRHFTT